MTRARAAGHLVCLTLRVRKELHSAITSLSETTKPCPFICAQPQPSQRRDGTTRPQRRLLTLEQRSRNNSSFSSIVCVRPACRVARA
jgi:hypothetical protein